MNPGVGRIQTRTNLRVETAEVPAVRTRVQTVGEDSPVGLALAYAPVARAVFKMLDLSGTYCAG